MLTILEGQISFGGVHDALEAVSRHKNVKNGVLRISSNKASGLIGVFCGRFITGAFVTLTGETGPAALQKLIAATDGTFAFMDAMGDDMPELKQSLAVDIALLSSTGDNSSAVSEQTLTGANEGESIKLIDTSVNFDDDAPLLTNAERADRLSKTYDKLMSLAEYEKMRRNDSSDVPSSAAPTPPPTTDQYDVTALRRKVAPSAPVELTNLIPEIASRMEEEEQLVAAMNQEQGFEPVFEPRELTPTRVSGPPPVSRPIELTEMMPEIARRNDPTIHDSQEFPVQSFGTVGYINHEQQEFVEHSEDDYDPRYREPQDPRPSVHSDFKRLKHWPNRSRTIVSYLSIILVIALSLGVWVAYNKYVAQQSEMGPPVPTNVSTSSGLHAVHGAHR